MSVDPDEYDDPANPPPGYTLVDCPGCSSDGPKPRHLKMAVAAGTGTATTFCPVCRGRGWTWYPTAELEH